jgi:hypothetical protein
MGIEVKLHLAFVKDRTINRIEFDWTDPLTAIEFARDLIKESLAADWDGHVYIDDKPILSDDSDPMFLAHAVRGLNGAVDFKVSKLAWKFPAPPERMGN